MPYSPPTSLRAAFVAVQLPDADDQAFAASIAERVRLGRTLGVEMVATVTRRRRASQRVGKPGRADLPT